MGVTETIVKQVNTQTHEKSEVLNVDTGRVVFVSKFNYIINYQYQDQAMRVTLRAQGRNGSF